MADVQSSFLRNAPLPDSPFLSEGYPPLTSTGGGGTGPALTPALLRSNLSTTDSRLFAIQPLVVNPLPDYSAMQTPFQPQQMLPVGRIETITNTTDASELNFIRQIDDLFNSSDYLLRAQPLAPQANGWNTSIPIEPQRLPPNANISPNGFIWQGPGPFVPQQSGNVYPFAPQTNGYHWTYQAEQNQNIYPFAQPPYSNGWQGTGPYPYPFGYPFAAPGNPGWGSTPYWGQPPMGYPFTGPIQPNSPVNPQTGGETRPRQPVQPVQPVRPEVQPVQPVQPVRPEVQPVQPVQPVRPEVQPVQPVQPVQASEYPGVSDAEAMRFDQTISSTNRFSPQAKQRALYMDAQEQACFNEINRIRAQNNLPPLDFSPTVKLGTDIEALQAALPSNLPNRYNPNNHNIHNGNSNNRFNFGRLERDIVHNVENAALGQQSQNGTAVADRWVNEPAHRSSILNPNATIGAVSRTFDNQGRPHWTFHSSDGYNIVIPNNFNPNPAPYVPPYRPNPPYVPPHHNNNGRRHY